MLKIIAKNKVYAEHIQTTISTDIIEPNFHLLRSQMDLVAYFMDAKSAISFCDILLQNGDYDYVCYASSNVFTASNNTPPKPILQCDGYLFDSDSIRMAENETEHRKIITNYFLYHYFESIKPLNNGCPYENTILSPLQHSVITNQSNIEEQ